MRWIRFTFTLKAARRYPLALRRQHVLVRTATGRIYADRRFESVIIKITYLEELENGDGEEGAEDRAGDDFIDGVDTGLDAALADE